MPPCSYLSPMQKVGIKALKNELSHYIRVVAAGETVLVTDRDRVVAELVPPRVADGGTLAERNWAELVRRGVVRLATVPLNAPPPRNPLMTFAELMADLDADREDR